MAKQSLENWDARYKSLPYWLAVFFGSGLIRPAPGTWGSLAGLILGYLALTSGVGWLSLLIATLVVTIVGIWAINQIEKTTGVHDAPEIVIDEVAGQWLAIMPLAYYGWSEFGFLLAFGLFRLFDILKPWPIGWLDRQVSGGFGVMIDDIVAGIQAAAILFAMMYFGVI